LQKDGRSLKVLPSNILELFGGLKVYEPMGAGNLISFKFTVSLEIAAACCDTIAELPLKKGPAAGTKVYQERT
jgi:hypothetical protein